MNWGCESSGLEWELTVKQLAIFEYIFVVKKRFG